MHSEILTQTLNVVLNNLKNVQDYHCRIKCMLLLWFFVKQTLNHWIVFLHVILFLSLTVFAIVV